MREVGVLEAKTKLSALLDAVENGGEEIVITRNGRPVAQLSRISERPRSEQEMRDASRELMERLRRLNEQLVRDHPAAAEPFDLREAMERR